MTDANSFEQMLQRMCGEYLEMPGLRLTCRQAQRLWGLDEMTCVELLDLLIDAGFLRQTRDGTYARTSDGPSRMPQLRMAKAGLPTSAALIPDTDLPLQQARAIPRR